VNIIESIRAEAGLGEAVDPALTKIVSSFASNAGIKTNPARWSNTHIKKLANWLKNNVPAKKLNSVWVFAKREQAKGANVDNLVTALQWALKGHTEDTELDEVRSPYNPKRGTVGANAKLAAHYANQVVAGMEGIDSRKEGIPYKLKEAIEASVAATKAAYEGVRKVERARHEDTEFSADLVEDVRQAAGLTEAMASHNKDGLTFTIQTANGKKYTGMVQGSGGTIKGLKRLKAAIRMATDGQDFEDRLNIYSPKPLHVKVYRGRDTGYGSEFDVVNLAGAKILAAK